MIGVERIFAPALFACRPESDRKIESPGPSRPDDGYRGLKDDGQQSGASVGCPPRDVGRLQLQQAAAAAEHQLTDGCHVSERTHDKPRRPWYFCPPPPRAKTRAHSAQLHWPASCTPPGSHPLTVVVPRHRK